MATGAKLANHELTVIVTGGDGDGYGIGGNHFTHTARRNIDLTYIVMNNQIYGLTKGQYSPTSELGKVTKSTPLGSLDHPFNPPQLALGASGTFIARTIDRELKHMGAMIQAASKDEGTSFIEIYQNCNIFNDGAFSELTEKETKAETQLVLVQGQPMIFGASNNKGLILEGSNFKVVTLGKNYSADDILKHDMNDKNLAMLLSEITYNPELPVPIGILYQENKPTYDKMMTEQIKDSIQSQGKGDLDKLFFGTNSWVVE